MRWAGRADAGEPADAALDAELTVVCRQVVELVTDYLEGALPGQLQDAVERHLAVCPPCVVYVEQMRTTAAALRGTLPSSPSTPTPAPSSCRRSAMVSKSGDGEPD